MKNFIKIGIEKYDEDFDIPYDPNMTLGTFKEVLEKAIGSPCKLNISNFDKKKNLKMLEYATVNIFTVNNENLGSFISKWKGNFKNENNSCFKDSFFQSFVHSLAENLVKKEEALRTKKGLPPAKNFGDYKNNNENGESDNHSYNDCLEVLNIIKTKMKNKELEPIHNTYDISKIFKDQKYSTGGSYTTDNIGSMSRSSTSTSSGLRGGLISYHLQYNKNFNRTYVKDHEIFFKEKTVISDCLGIEVRNFMECTKCHFSDISVINIGNIAIPMYDYLISSGEKSFNGLLKYYYKINNFGNKNLKYGEICNKCKTHNLQSYNQISTLPDVLLIDFNLEKYYINTSNSQLQEESFYWALEEQISLKDNYDRIKYDISSINDCYYELTSFIGHYGDKEHGHFINFSKVDDKWYLFDDLRKEPFEIGNFSHVKMLIEKQIFSFSLIDQNGTKIATVQSKLKICNCFYKIYKCKGYEQYIEEIKNIIKKTLNK